MSIISRKRIKNSIVDNTYHFIEGATWWLEKGKPISVGLASLQIARDILPDYLRLSGI
jgi:hypothetical protein